jgi:pimeloyl-ACP methyl ester carboxylesterase
MSSIDLSATDNLPSPEALRSAAEDLVDFITDVETQVSDARAGWTPMRDFYEAPEQETVWAAFDGPNDVTGELADTTRTLKTALVVFAAEVETLQARRAALLDDVAAHEGKDYDNHEDKDGGASVLQSRASNLAGDYQEAREHAIAQIQKVDRVTRDVSLVSEDATMPSFAVAEGTALFNRLNSFSALPGDWPSYLAFLASLSASEVKEFKRSNPAAAAFMTSRATSNPKGNRAWWDSIQDPAARERISAVAPTLIGNMEGLPYADRAAANAIALAAAIKRPNNTKTQQAAYDNIRKALSTGRRGSGSRSLLSFDTSTDPPLAALAIGDPDTAENVTWLVPGMGQTTEQMDEWTTTSQNVWAESTDLEERIGQRSQAVIAWVGYDTPDMIGLDNVEVLNMEKARAGGEKLDKAVEGLMAARQLEAETYPYRHNIVAHSYGTTTAAEGLTRLEGRLNSVVMVGSAGLDPTTTDHASDFDVDRIDGVPEVYAGQSSQDLVAKSGHWLSEFDGLGQSEDEKEDDQRIVPTSTNVKDGLSDFGAHVFSVEASKINGDDLHATEGHGTRGDGGKFPVGTPAGRGYLDSDTTSLRNVGLIITGRGDKIYAAPDRPRPEED